MCWGRVLSSEDSVREMKIDCGPQEAAEIQLFFDKFSNALVV